MKRRRKPATKVAYKGAYVEIESRIVFFFVVFTLASMFLGWLAT